MEINIDHPVYTVHGLMKNIQPQGIPGTLCLLEDAIYFGSGWVLKGSEIKMSFILMRLKV